MDVLMTETLRITGISMGTIFAVMVVLYAAIKIMVKEKK